MRFRNMVISICRNLMLGRNLPLYHNILLHRHITVFYHSDIATSDDWKQLRNVVIVLTVKRPSYWCFARQHMLLEIFSESKAKKFWFLSPFWATNQDVSPFQTVKICCLLPTILSQIDRTCVVYMQMGWSKWIGPKDYPCAVLDQCILVRYSKSLFQAPQDHSALGKISHLEKVIPTSFLLLRIGEGRKREEMREERRRKRGGGRGGGERGERREKRRVEMRGEEREEQEEKRG